MAKRLTCNELISVRFWAEPPKTMKHKIIDNKVINKRNEVAVLYSPGFGAGWSTWAYDEKVKQECIFDPDCVFAILEGDKQKAQTIAEKKWGEGGYWNTDKLEVTWVKRGQAFKIDEYDGYESIIFNYDVEWIIA